MEDDEAHHLGRVLRKQPGDRVELFDGVGGSAESVVVEVARKKCRLRVANGWQQDEPPKRELVIATAFPKGDRARFLVEKATELDVARIVPLHTSRSVVAPRDSKLDKLRQTVVAACKQCGRNRLLEIDEPIAWSSFLPGELGHFLVASPGATAAALGPPSNRVTIAVGPEGGFTDDELSAARDVGAEFVGLGRHILRIETAAIAAATVFG